MSLCVILHTVWDDQITLVSCILLIDLVSQNWINLTKDKKTILEFLFGSSDFVKKQLKVKSCIVHVPDHLAFINSLHNMLLT